jgi:hypothetical protein
MTRKFLRESDPHTFRIESNATEYRGKQTDIPPYAEEEMIEAFLIMAFSIQDPSEKSPEIRNLLIDFITKEKTGRYPNAEAFLLKKTKRILT